MSVPDSRYRHSVRIRYGEVDQQGVAYNAHYMVYIDEVLEGWIAIALFVAERATI